LTDFQLWADSRNCFGGSQSRKNRNDPANIKWVHEELTRRTETADADHWQEIAKIVCDCSKKGGVMDIRPNGPVR